MPQLKALPKLQNLTLGGTRITRDGLLHLKAIPRLRWVVLGEGLLNEEIRTDLKQANPDLAIQTVATKSETQAALDAILKTAEEKPVHPNGTWKWTMPWTNDTRPWVLQLELKEERLTGTVIGPNGDVTSIQETQVKGDVISFRWVREADRISATLAGKIIGDTIQGKIAIQRADAPPQLVDWQPKREAAK